MVSILLFTSCGIVTVPVSVSILVNVKIAILKENLIGYFCIKLFTVKSAVNICNFILKFIIFKYDS